MLMLKTKLCNDYPKSVPAEKWNHSKIFIDRKLYQKVKGRIESLHKELVYVATTVSDFGQASLIISQNEAENETLQHQLDALERHQQTAPPVQLSLSLKPVTPWH